MTNNKQSLPPWFLPYMAILVFVVGVIFLAWMVSLLQDTPEFMTMVGGSLLTMVGTIVNYAFGSSRGSAQKSDDQTEILLASRMRGAPDE